MGHKERSMAAKIQRFHETCVHSPDLRPCLDHSPSTCTDCFNAVVKMSPFFSQPLILGPNLGTPIML